MKVTGTVCGMLFQTITRLQPGASATLKVVREQKTLGVPVKLGERPAVAAPPPE